MHGAIIDHPAESRKEWMIQIFKTAGNTNSRNTDYQFWQQDNQPKNYINAFFCCSKIKLHS